MIGRGIGRPNTELNSSDGNDIEEEEINNNISKEEIENEDRKSDLPEPPCRNTVGRWLIYFQTYPSQFVWIAQLLRNLNVRA